MRKRQRAHGPVDRAGRRIGIHRTGGQVHPRHAAAGAAVEGGEIARDIDPVVGLVEQEGPHRAVTTCKAVQEGRVQSAVRVQQGNATPAGAIHRGELAADEHLAAAEDRNSVDRIISAGQTSHEARVQRAVRVQACHAPTRRAAHAGKLAANDHLADVGGEELVGIGVNRHGVHRHRAARKGQRRRDEARVERAICIEPADLAAGRAREVGERAPHHELVARAQGDRQHARVRAGHGVKRLVQCRARRKAHEVIIARPADALVAGERAAHDVVARAARRLCRQRMHRAVKARAEAHAGVHLTGALQQDDSVQQQTTTCRAGRASDSSVRQITRHARVAELRPGQRHVHNRNGEGAIEGAVHSADHHQVAHTQAVAHGGRQRRDVRRHVVQRIGANRLAGHCHTEIVSTEITAHHEAATCRAQEAAHAAIGTRAHAVAEGGVHRAGGVESCQPVNRARRVAGLTERIDRRRGYIRRRPRIAEREWRDHRHRRHRVGAVKGRIHAADRHHVIDRQTMRSRRSQRRHVTSQRLVGHCCCEGRAGEVAAHEVGAGAVRRAVGDDRPHEPVRATERVERGVEAAVCVQARDAVDRRAVESGEIAADDDFVVRLNQHRPHLGVGPGQQIEEGGVQAAVRVESDHVLPSGHGEGANHKHAAIRLHGHPVNLAIDHRRNKRRVQHAGGQEAGHAGPRRRVHGVERATDDNLANIRGQERILVPVNAHRVHVGVRACQTTEEGGIQRAVRIEASKPVAARAVERGELADHDHLRIVLHSGT